MSAAWFLLIRVDSVKNEVGIAMKSVQIIQYLPCSAGRWLEDKYALQGIVFHCRFIYVDVIVPIFALLANFYFKYLCLYQCSQQLLS